MKTSEQIVLDIPFERPIEKGKEVPLMVFVFDANGELLERSAVSGAQATLRLGKDSQRGARIFIAPAVEKRIESVTTISDLERYKPYESHIRFDPKGKASIMPIPVIFPPIWLGYWCRVRGKVVKNFTIGPSTGLKGLCHARVHICEVDRIWWWIDRIPDHVIIKIPDIVLTPIPKPEPDPGPIRPIGPGPIERVTTLLPREMFKTTNVIKKLKTDESSEALQHFSKETQRLLFSKNAASIRQVIKDNFQLFHPYFCYWKWLWPYFYHCDEIAVVYTDDFGNFDTSIFAHWGDKPDLYFWVEYLIDGVWTTVYKPGIPCHTHWNFVCGSEITITVTDSRVPWACQNIIPGEAIWVKTVGHGVSVNHIKQTDDVGPVIEGIPFNRIGLTDAAMAGSMANGKGYIRPFGTMMYFIVQFGSGLPNNNITYYRWSARKIRNVDLSPAIGAVTKIFGDPIGKSYTYEFTDLTGTHFNSKSYPLGPHTVGATDNLFQIPPVNPAMSPVNATETNAQWDQNTVVVMFDSKQFNEDGLYQFTMELFDSSGNKVDVAKNVWQIPHYSTFTPSINAPDNYLSLHSPDTGSARAYKMLMRIDNTISTPDIYKIGVLVSPGVYQEASPNCCGFVSYPPAQHANVNFLRVSYRAFHPQNFAWSNFDIQKGTCGSASHAGPEQILDVVPDSVVAGNYSRDVVGVYQKHFSPDQLLGSCASEGKAAFAETLNIETTTTNGNALAFGNVGDVAAFALEPS